MVYNLEFLMTAEEYRGIKDAFNYESNYKMKREYELYGNGKLTVEFEIHKNTQIFLTLKNNGTILREIKYENHYFERIENIYILAISDFGLITINLIEGFSKESFPNEKFHQSSVFKKVRVKYEEGFIYDLEMFIRHSDLTKEENLISSLYVVDAYLINENHSFVDIIKDRLLDIGFDIESVLTKKSDSEDFNRLLEEVDNLENSINSDGIIFLLLSILKIYSSKMSKEKIEKMYPKLLELDADSLFLGIKYTYYMR